MNAPTIGFVAKVRPEQSSGYRTLVIDDTTDSATMASWHQFLVAQKAHFFQTPQWLTCMLRNEQAMATLTLLDGRVVASSVMRRRPIPGIGKGIYIVKRGPVSENEKALEIHLQQLGEMLKTDAVAIRISPYNAKSDRDAIECALERWNWKTVGDHSYMYDATIIVDLEQEIDEIRKGFRRSLRTQINKAGKSGVSVRHDIGHEEFSTFMREFNAMAQRRNLATIDAGTAEEMEYMNGKPGGVKLFVCDYEGEQVAGALMIPAGDRIIYRWGYSSEAEAHRKLPLSHALHWQAIQWARENNYRYYDFGGYWEERADEDPINRFKTGFSKLLEKHVREHVLVLRPAIHATIKQLTRLRKHLK